MSYFKRLPAIESKPLIVIADDQRADRLLLKMAFAEAKLKANIAEYENGLDLIDFIENKSNKVIPKLIMLDIEMPKRSGIEVLEVLKGNNGLRNVPVVIFSASSDPQHSEQSRGLGAIEYIKKPQDLEGFLSLVLYIKKYLKE